MTTAAERGVAALRRALETGEVDLLDVAVDELRAAGDAPATLANLGAALRTRHRWAPQPGDLDEAIDALSRAVGRSHPADPALAGRLGTWGVALGDRFERSSDERDLTASVAALEAALTAAGPDQVVRQSGNLSGALLERYRLDRDPADLDRAIALAASERDEDLPATDTDRDTARGNLAAALHERFAAVGRPDDLDAAVAVTLRAAPSAKRLGTLGTLLHTRFVLTGSAQDLEDAVAVLTAAEAATRPRPGRPEATTRAPVLGVLGNALLDRFRWRGDTTDLDAAIARHRSAVDLTPASALDRAVRLSNLGVALSVRPEHDPGAAAELDEALRLHAEAVELAGARHPDRAAILAHQAGALLAAFSARGRADDGDAAIAVYRAALTPVADNPTVRAGYLAQLAQALRSRHRASGRAAELYEAVRVLREAIEMGGPEHRDHPSFCSYLGSALTARYLLHGSAGDLDEAIAWHDRAAAGSTPGRVGSARLFAARAHALRLRAERSGDPQDVTASIDASRVALAAEADAARLPDLVAALGSALDLRRDTAEDVTATIEVRRRACELTDPDDPYRGLWLSDLANSLRLRAALLGDAGSDDLAEAHPLHVEAVAVTAPQHPEYATVLSNLAGSHRDRYARTGDAADLDAAVDLLSRTAAVASAPAIRRLVAAETGGRLAADTGRWAQACDAYAAAIDVLPAAAWRGADRLGQERPVRDTRWLAVEAAAAALQLDDPVLAVDLLERGRTVRWNQQLEIDADFSAARRTAPALVARLDAARAVLDTDGSPDRSVSTADARVAAAADWDAATAELRARPGLAALLPVRAGPPEGLGGTVALIVVSRYRRDAVLVDRAGYRVLPLPELDLDVLADQVGSYFTALGAVVDPADRAERADAECRLRSLLAWLGDVVVAPVVDAVPTGSRLWWCPTGPLTVLPLHAAGAAPDRVVSSSTPTIAALARAWHAEDRAEQRVLGVAVRDAPGHPALPGAPAELDELAATLPPDIAFSRPDVATRAAVGSALRTHSWAHLACHAEQDLSRPSRAALVLADGRLGLSEIARRPDRPAAGAYLSACQSALGGVELSDEALHLAAALQYAGFRRVIATLWPVTDRRARKAARQVYSTLCAGGGFHPDRSADAVHDLMLSLRRRYPDAPSQWAPFVHFGP